MLFFEGTKKGEVRPGLPDEFVPRRGRRRDQAMRESQTGFARDRRLANRGSVAP
jgi:hypothetical protein